VIRLVVVWVLVTLIASPAGASDSALPKTFKGSDPKGWREFQWRMTKAQAMKLGAQPFEDGEGVKRFGLSSVELLSGKTFWVDLKFFSHMGLNSVQVTLAP